MTGPGKYPVMDERIGAFVPHSLPPMAGSGQGPLVGHTFAVKDLYDIAGYATGGGSPDWLRTHEPATQTSGAVQRLLDAGADMVGKTVCDELFYSFTGANAHYGTPVNVRAPGHLPGGSSSGSAAATAAGLCEFALGSDTGGSVRLPASFCGLYGLRPTHGRVDLSHAMAMAQEANRYLDSQEPWKTMKDNPQDTATTLWVVLSVINCLKTALYPFLPFSSEKLHQMLGFSDALSEKGWSWEPSLGALPPGQSMAEPDPLFSKLEENVAVTEVERLGQVVS